jgi:hypothetical protein
VRRPPIYNKDGWMLGLCCFCGFANYVEPHGTTAMCLCSREPTEHRYVPQNMMVEIAGVTLYQKPPALRMGRNGRRVCGPCGHYFASHSWTPGQEGRAPDRCRVPECPCKEFVDRRYTLLWRRVNRRRMASESGT